MVYTWKVHEVSVKRVLVVIGTRPEGIKLAPVVHALAAHPGAEVRVCLTAQHRELLDEVVDFFELPVHHDLDVMRPGQSLTALTGRLLEGLGRVIAQEQPDVVVVQGDTSTAMVGALAAFYARVPVAHVEAGLRSGDLDNPFPEEANREVADLLSTWRFVPTRGGRQALLARGYDPCTVEITGNTVVDALLWARERVRARPPALPDALPEGAPFVLLTTHRRESFGGPIRRVLGAVSRLVRDLPELHVVFPAHPNPEVQRAIADSLPAHERVHVTGPVSYPTMVRWLAECRFLLSDSGGLQEEAPTFGKPVLVLRSVTERPEAVDAGVSRLVGTDPERIHAEAVRLVRDPAAYRAMTSTRNPYGDGRASERIARRLVDGASAAWPRVAGVASQAQRV